MKVQIKTISGHQSSKVFAILLALFTLPLALVGALGFAFAPPTVNQNGAQVNSPWMFFAFAPIFYGLAGYIFNRFACFVYNLVALRFGGIELQLNKSNNCTGDKQPC